MPVSIFRRHSRTCPHKAEGRAWDRCGCTYWADPRPIGPLQSLGTKDRQTAQKMARDMEVSGGAYPTRESTGDGPMKLKDAKDAFFVNLTVRNLATATVYKHKILWRQCLAFAEKNRLEFVVDLNPTMIDQFVGTWNDAALGRGRKLERFRQFFKFAVSRDWIEEDPTAGMKGPIVKSKQTPPFTPNGVPRGRIGYARRRSFCSCGIRACESSTSSGVKSNG